MSYLFPMRMITVKVDDLLWKEIELTLDREHYAISEFVRSAVRDKIFKIRRRNGRIKEEL